MMIPEDIYSQIVCLMPIPCVDILVEDEQGRILLVKRADEPAKGQWWFPGGRIHFLETRIDAATRKLSEECGFDTISLIELGTYDVIVSISGNTGQSHGITTLFCAKYKKGMNLHLDAQSSSADWRLPDEWLKEELYPFVRQSLHVFMRRIYKP